MLLKLERILDKFSNIVGMIASVAIILMILNVSYDVVMRYYFKSGSIAMQEMEWHLFSILILFGISYTLKEEGHVRVDLIYDTLSDKKKAFINLSGTIFFILPLAILIINSSLPYVIEAYTSNEISGDPGGLHYRWLVKALIPLSFIFLIITSIGYFIRNWNVYKGRTSYKANNLNDEIKELKKEIAVKKEDLI